MAGFEYRLRIRAIVAHVLGAGALWVVARTVHASFDFSEWYPAKVVLSFVAGTILCVTFVAGSHPHARYGPANLVTMIRGAFVTLIVGLIGEAAAPRVAAFAAVLAMAVAVLDGVDGWIARSTGMSSRFGARFDMETDSALVLALSVLAWQYEKAGVWVLGIGLMRYAFVGAGFLVPWMAGPLSPTLRGRAVAVVQMGALAFVVAPIVPGPLSSAVAAIALAALIWSFGVDIGRLWRVRGSS